MKLERRDFREMFSSVTSKNRKVHLIRTKFWVVFFGEQAPSYTTAKNWFAEFCRARSSLEDELFSGKPSDAVTPENIEAVRKIVEADRRVTCHEIQAQVGIGSGSLHKILHDHLFARKLVFRWVSHMLTPE